MTADDDARRMVEFAHRLAILAGLLKHQDHPERLVHRLVASAFLIASGTGTVDAFREAVAACLDEESS